MFCHVKKSLTFRLTLAACLVFWIFVFVDSGWGPDLTPLSIQLHTPLSIVGLFYVIWSTGYLPGALVGGAMLDRYGPRRVLLGSLAVMTVAFALMPLIRTAGHAFAVYALWGIGSGCFWPSRNSTWPLPTRRSAA